MKKLFLSICIISTFLYSDDSSDIGSDFLTSLDEVNEIATKTKLNIDDTPSFVTVLHSSKLKKLGITNVFEALGLVPGVELKKESSGVPIVVFRGLDEKGEVKFMVDGVVINNHYRGSSYYYLNFPLDLVRRIEVIRGAGSVFYGSNAMSGVINIITNSSQKDVTNTVFASGGSYSRLQGGAIVSAKLSEIQLSLDAYYQKNNKTIYVKPNPSPIFGDSDRHLKDYSLGVRLSSEHFALTSRIKQDDIGNAYGILGVIDDKKEKYNNKNRSIFTQLSYKNRYNNMDDISILAGYTNYQQIAYARHPNPAITTLDAEYEESSHYAQLDYISRFVTNHKISLGARYESADTKKSAYVTATGKTGFISDPKFSQKVTSIYFEDIFSATNNFDISTGLRYDHCADMGGNYSPNIGLVYRINKILKLKAHYNNAFRSPSWVELTSNPNLKPETSRSYEAGTIIKPNQKNTARVNFYIYDVEDMIQKVGRVYVQNTQNRFYGGEAEYIYSPDSKLEVSFLASYVKATDTTDTKRDLADIANILASTAIIYELDSGFIFGSLLKYVSKSSREEGDDRDDKPDSYIFDQSISYIYKDFRASLIIKDLFDAATNYALPLENYAQDFDDGGRNFLLKLSLDF